MDNRPVGIFDSGLGGLTALAALRRRMPEENIIYFADKGRVPYGAWSAEEIRLMARQDMDFIGSFGVKAMIAACGTVSTNADSLIQSCSPPAVGVLRPAVKAVAETGGSGAVGIIATEASIRSGVYERELKKACPGRKILAAACPDFVTLIESGHRAASDPAVKEAVERYLHTMKEKKISVLLLGCTHYGLISEAIENYLGSGTELVSAADCAAEELAAYLKNNALTGGSAEESFYTSGSAEEFREAAGMLLGYKPGKVSHVPVMEVKVQL